jgi:hypothetical protein
MSVIPVQNQLPALLDHRGLAVFEAVSQDEPEIYLETNTMITPP